MRHARLAVAIVLGFLGFAAGAAPVRANDPSIYPPLVHVPQGVGCYWYRGRLHCNRYCYWEIDGRRFCRRDARDAYTQAPPEILDLPGYDEAPDRPPRSRRFPGAAGGSR